MQNHCNHYNITRCLSNSVKLAVLLNVADAGGAMQYTGDGDDLAVFMGVAGSFINLWRQFQPGLDDSFALLRVIVSYALRVVA